MFELMKHLEMSRNQDGRLIWCRDRGACTSCIRVSAVRINWSAEILRLPVIR
jgi:hypothetical protein